MRRAAADALGRHPAAENIRPLLDLRHAVPGDDTHLLLRRPHGSARSAAAGGELGQAADRSWTERDARAIADVSLGVPSAEAAAYLMRHLKRYRRLRRAAGQQRASYRPLRRRVGDDASCSTSLAAMSRTTPAYKSPCSAPSNAAPRNAVPNCGAGADLGRGPVGPLARLEARSRRTERHRVGWRAAADRSAGRRLAEIARERGAPKGQRRAALDALANIDAQRNAAVLGGVLGDAEAPFPLREQMRSTCWDKPISPRRWRNCSRSLPQCRPGCRRVIAVGLAGSPTGCRETARRGQDRQGVGTTAPGSSRRPAPEASRASTKLKERLAELTAGLPPAGRACRICSTAVAMGFLKAKKDVASARQVFVKNCANCHQVGGQGAKIGPQLDGVGVRGLDRLLEDILDPNRNVDQAFRLTTLNLKKGQVVSGLLLKEEGAVLVLADAQGKEVRVAKDAVEERERLANLADAGQPRRADPGGGLLQSAGVSADAAEQTRQSGWEIALS